LRKRRGAKREGCMKYCHWKPDYRLLYFLHIAIE